MKAGSTSFPSTRIVGEPGKRRLLDTSGSLASMSLTVVLGAHVVDDVMEERAGRLVIGAVLEPEKLDVVGHAALSLRRFDRRQDDSGR